MDQEKRKPVTEDTDEVEISERRQALLTTGKFAAYAAPFTLMALSKKADAASGHGHLRRNS